MYYVGRIRTQPGQKAENLNFHFDVPDNEARNIQFNRNRDFDSILESKEDYKKKALKIRMQELFFARYDSQSLNVQFSLSLRTKGIEAGGRYVPILPAVIWNGEFKLDNSIIIIPHVLRRKLFLIDQHARGRHGTIINNAPRFEFKLDGPVPRNDFNVSKYQEVDTALYQCRFIMPPLTRISIRNGAWIFFVLGFGNLVVIEDMNHNPVSPTSPFDPNNYWASIYNGRTKTEYHTHQINLPFRTTLEQEFDRVMKIFYSTGVFQDIADEQSDFWNLPRNMNDISIEISKLLPDKMSFNTSFFWNPVTDGIRGFSQSFSRTIDDVLSEKFNVESGHFKIQKVFGKEAISIQPNYLVYDIHNKNENEDKSVFSRKILMEVKIERLDTITSAWFPMLDNTILPLNAHFEAQKDPQLELRELLLKRDEDTQILAKVERVGDNVKGMSLDQECPIALLLHSHDSQIQYYAQNVKSISGCAGVLKSRLSVKSDDVTVTGLPCSLKITLLNIEKNKPVVFTRSQDLIFTAMIFPL